jgi:hypothetical protein
VSKPRTRLQFEELEARTLLSSTALSSAALGDGLAALATSRQPALKGTLKGTYQLGPSVPASGATFELAGSGNVTPLSKVTASGFLQALRFISTGHAGGLVTLTNRSGAVKLQLTGTSAGASRLPKHFTFLLVWGSGAYAHLNHGGTVNLTLTPAKPTRPPHKLSSQVTVPVSGKASSTTTGNHTAGTFTLTIGL